MKKKRILSFVFCTGLLLGCYAGRAQAFVDSVPGGKQDTVPTVTRKPLVERRRNHADTTPLRKEVARTKTDTGSSSLKKPGFSFDSTGVSAEVRDSIADMAKTTDIPAAALDSQLLAKNRYINSSGKPVSLAEHPYSAPGKEFLFYLLCLVLLILGLFRTFFTGYFKNLFRFYFNTSLRQTQLSDQLQQATLPSLILNIFFAITAGIYIWLLFNYYHPPRLFNGRALLPFCVLSIAVLYFIKFCMLKFMGWISDVQESTNSYIFALFLVNKITGIFLVPVIICMAFVNRQWQPVIIDISFMILGLLFLSRYAKSYGAIEKKLPLNPFHFLIYIAGAEIIPLFILYKVAIDYLI